MQDRDFLIWIHERLEHVHNENPLMDYIHKLRAIISITNPNQCTPNTGKFNGIDALQDQGEK